MAAISKEIVTIIIKRTIEEEKNCVSEAGKLSPKVAAALVKNGELIEIAFRGELGEGDHAEYTLFEKKLKGRDVTGATLFTTLEPCTTRRNHKPCSEWIIEKNISKVFIGMLDPNPKIYLEGVKKLKSAGIDIDYYDDEFRRQIKNDNADFIKQYRANPELKGEATFDFTNNNGIYTVGHQEYIFELKFSNASNQVIHTYNNASSIDCISEVTDCDIIEQIADASVYDTSSKSRTINKNGIVLFKNISGYYCAVKIVDLYAKSHGDDRDEVSIIYRILPEGDDFRIPQ